MIKINVLLLEDMADDAELIILQLEKEGFEVNWIREFTEQGMKKRLIERDWDAVISDFVMPGFSGFDALDILKECKKDIPFIIISGTVGEEVAVEAMKRGAHDYIMKDNLARLGAALKRELKESEIRRKHIITKNTLVAKEDQLNAIFSAAPIGIGTLVDRKFTVINQRTLDLLGYDYEELIGVSTEFLYESEEEFERVGYELYEKDPDELYSSVETKFRKKSGELVDVIINISYFDRKNNSREVAFTIEDVSDKKKAERKLAESEARLASIFKSAPIGIGTLINKVIQFVNEPFCKMLGYTKDELIGENSRILYLDDDEFNRVEKEKYNQLERFGVGSLETVCRKKDGTPISIFMSSSVIDQNDLSKGVTFTIHDISERKRFELLEDVTFNIATTANKTKSLNELISHIRDELSRVIDTHNFYIALYNAKEDSFSLPYFADEKDTYDEIPAGKTLTKYVIDCNKPLLLKNQDIIDLENQGVVKRYASPSKCWMGVPLKNDLETIGVLSIQSYSDENAFNTEDLNLLNYVSEQIATSIKIKEYQDYLVENENRYRTLADASNEAIFISENGVCIDTNKKATEMFGYSYDELIGIFGTDVIAEESKELVKNNMISGYESPYEAMAQHKDGHVFPALFQGKMYPYKGKNTRLTTVRDLSEQKKYELEILVAKEKAEESDRLKSAFLANMSHEIRTPMNAIIGFSQLLDDPDLNDDQKSDYIRLVNANGQMLMRLIDDLIDVSRIEAGELSIREQEINLNKQLRDIAASHENNIKEQNINIEFKLNLPTQYETIRFVTDPDRFNQIINNLLSNAIKFTKKGFIELGYEIVKMSDKNIEDLSYISLFVKDTGIGIPKDKCDVIFDRFRQVEESHTRNYGGTGLGLTITRKIVELMGGKIWLESELGQGSTFYITLPINNEAVEEVEPQTLRRIDVENRNITGKDILVVEDVDSNFYYIKKVLEPFRINCTWARDGLEALDFLAQNKSFDLILMDIQLPKRNGYEITKDIKSMNINIPIIAQTAYARYEDRERCLKAGCVDYIAKPINKNTLVEKIMEYIL